MYDIYCHVQYLLPGTVLALGTVFVLRYRICYWVQYFICFQVQHLVLSSVLYCICPKVQHLQYSQVKYFKSSEFATLYSICLPCAIFAAVYSICCHVQHFLLSCLVFAAFKRIFYQVQYPLACLGFLDLTCAGQASTKGQRHMPHFSYNLFFSK
jgi:hypothetical protein